jgi:hypothetical protein
MAVYFFAACFGCYLLLTLFLARRFVTLMMDAIISSETAVLTRATRLTSQQTAFLVVTAVKTSDLKIENFFATGLGC